MLRKVLFAISDNLLSFTGKMIHSMVAHLDAVTSLAVDPNGLYLLSGSKYACSFGYISTAQ
jgi:hypothetical protein